MAQEVMATVESITGSAQARNADGELRQLKVGDKLREGETLVTPNGGRVELSFTDGDPLVINDIAEVAITKDLVAKTATGADESALQAATAQNVIDTLASGEDLTQTLPSTAALGDQTGSGSGLEGEGHSFVRLARILETTDEFSGIVGSVARETDAIEDENFIPVDAIDDAATTEQGVPVVINVQPNDDFQLGSNVIGVTNGANGTVVINADNTVTYTPNPGFFGTDVFTYTALSADGNGQDTANVTVVIPGEPEEPVEPEVPPTIFINDDIVVEGETATLTISLSKPWGETVTVQYKTSDDTAVAPGDYDPVTGLVTVTFAPGETSKEVTFSTNTDNLEELTEQFFVNLSNPTNATIADPTGIVEITDDFTQEPDPDPDPVPGALSIKPGESVLDEANLPDGSVPAVLPANDTAAGLAALSLGALAADEAPLPTKSGIFTVVAEDGLGTLSITADQAFFDNGTPGHGPAETADDVLQAGGTAVVFDITKGGFQPGMFIIEEGVVKITFDNVTGPAPDLANPGGPQVYTISVTATLLGPFVHEYQGPTDDQITLEVTVNMSDEDGDTASATYVAVVLDDVPEAKDDNDTVLEGAQATGNVFTGVEIAVGEDDNDDDGVKDIQGADGASIIGARAATDATDDTDVMVLPVSVIAGTYGELTLSANGDYTYEADSNIESLPDGAKDYFAYTIEDGDGDRDTAILTINVTASDLSAPDDMDAEVREEALDLDDTGDLVAGTVVGSNPGSAAETDADNQLTATGGAGGYTYELVGPAAGNYGTIQINENGSYTYSLQDPVNSTPDASDGKNIEAGTTEEFTYKVTDAAGNTAEGKIQVAVVDDIPILPAPQQLSTSALDTNILIVLDISGSMDFASGVPGKERWEVTNEAINKIVAAYEAQGDVKVRLVTFNGSANKVGGSWIDSDGLTLPGNNPAGTTNYDDALLKAMDAFDDAGKLDGARNVSYFFSDGNPNDSNPGNGDDGIQSGEETTWVNFLNANNIDSYALAMGVEGAGGNDPIDSEEMNPIAHDGLEGAPGTERDAVVASFDELDDVLLGTVYDDVKGFLYGESNNIDAMAGADGPQSLRLTIAGTVYVYDVSANQFTNDQNAHIVPNSELIVDIPDVGTWTIDAVTGSFEFSPREGFGEGDFDSVFYTLIDNDGDTTSSSISVEFDAIDDGAPVPDVLQAAQALQAEVPVEEGAVLDANPNALIATDGDDIFAFQLEEVPANVTIVNFGESGADVLDLHDLLVGEEGADLTSYLNVSLSEDGADTIIQVSSAGMLAADPNDPTVIDPASVDQIIVLEGVDMAGGGDNAAAIQQMLESGKLITD